MIYCCSQAEAVPFFFCPFSESVMFTLSVLFLFLFSHFLISTILTISVSFYSKSWCKDNDLAIGMQVNLCPEKHPTSHVNTPALPHSICSLQDGTFLTPLMTIPLPVSNPPFLQYGDRLTSTARFWLEPTWVWTGPKKKEDRMGPEWARQTVIMFDLCLLQALTHGSPSAGFVCVHVVLMEAHGSHMCLWMHGMQDEGRWGWTWCSN